ncbi:hypothetical protein CJF32_00010134 [Rutstroemia sp. NJR-2017a WRK4]|nr:hypothetical protein CJF32_00010134 [Rutstroemia sp. NJR-2017a WRK4]
MDLQPIHGTDSTISTFPSSTPHRLPTISAAVALQNLESPDLLTTFKRYISTGLQNLDLALQNKDAPDSSASTNPPNGGISRGKVTELYGPSGVAKALGAGESVVWVDASHPLPGFRFAQVLASCSRSGETHDYPDLVKNFHHFSTPTLAHLLGLFAHPDTQFPPKDTSLVIIDSLSTLIDTAFPRNVNPTSTMKNQGVPNPTSRKPPLLQYLITSLQKLAETRNIAILIFSQCVTKMRSGLAAALVPAVANPAWETGLWCRVVLFRDWGWDWDDDVKREKAAGRGEGSRYALVVKAEGVVLGEGRGRCAGFVVGETGVSSLPVPTQTLIDLATVPIRPQHHQTHHTSHLQQSTSLPQKRKRTEEEVEVAKERERVNEIPDSDAEDDEDYGWAEEDEEDMPIMPPQWQGSEDILVAPPLEETIELDDEGREGGERVEIDDEDEEVGLGSNKASGKYADGREAEEDGGRGLETNELVAEERELQDSEDELAL